MKPERWAQLREIVINRDLFRGYMRQPVGVSFRTYTEHGSPCIATFLDPESGPCAGPITLDHVKCFLMMGRKAPDTARHLVSVCRGHHLDTRAGRQWATANRALEREYLESIYGPCTECQR